MTIMAKTSTVENDPIDDTLLDHFYHPEVDPHPAASIARVKRRPRTVEKARPTHYKVCCISLYTEDIARLEAMVAELKRRGHSKANKSQLIRAALDQVDLSKVPKAP